MSGFTLKGLLLFSLTDFCISQQKKGKCSWQCKDCQNCIIQKTYEKVKAPSYGER